MKASRITLAASLALLAVGCTEQTGKVSVLIKDAPAGITAAVVTISEIQLVGSGGTFVLSTDETTTDLLTLANDTALLVEDVEVPAGTYSQLRFVITGGYVMADGLIYATPGYTHLPAETLADGLLRMPSYAQSGLKVDLPADVGTVGTASKGLLVDFDVSRSFGHEAGNSGAWVMHPVVKATDLDFAGSVDVALKLGAGVTLPPTPGTPPVPTTLADFKAVLTNSDGVSTKLALTSTDNINFTASFKYLFPGDYTLDFTAPGAVTSFETTPATIPPAKVTVVSQQAVAASFAVTKVN